VSDRHGVLHTEPADIRIEHVADSRTDDEDFFIRGGRLRLNLGGDTSGMIAGYFDLQHLVRAYFHRRVANAANGASWGWSVAGAYAALHKLADGHRNPDSGQCTAISTAFSIDTAPAFIVHRDAEPGRLAQEP
jgi:hypothetical protein